MRTFASPQLAALSRLFSSSVIQQMARSGRSPLFARLVTQFRLLDTLPPAEFVHGLFDAAFNLLKRRGHRDEYVYKAALVRRILLGRHSLQTACLLSEFRIGGCKLDMAILNGTSTAYEIKSERDSLARLDRQIAAYARVFASVYVITADRHVDSVMASVPSNIGILRLNDRDQISTLREAPNQPERISSAAVFDALRTPEAGFVLRTKGIDVPLVPNTQLRRVLQQLFTQLTPSEAHDGMVAVLKRTRSLQRLSDLVAQLPESLHTAALAVPMRKLDHERLIVALNTPLSDAMAWT